MPDPFSMSASKPSSVPPSSVFNSQPAQTRSSAGSGGFSPPPRESLDGAAEQDRRSESHRRAGAAYHAACAPARAKHLPIRKVVRCAVMIWRSPRLRLVPVARATDLDAARRVDDVLGELVLHDPALAGVGRIGVLPLEAVADEQGFRARLPGCCPRRSTARTRCWGRDRRSPTRPAVPASRRNRSPRRDEVVGVAGPAGAFVS